MPDLENAILGTICYQFLGVHERLEGYSKMIEQHAMLEANARRLMRMPGVGRCHPFPKNIEMCEPAALVCRERYLVSTT